MTEDTKKKILDWIYKNHMHHDGADRSELDLSTGKIVEHHEEYVCSEGDKPYVNSLDLEKFIKEL
jgi:hypothetical protein